MCSARVAAVRAREPRLFRPLDPARVRQPELCLLCSGSRQTSGMSSGLLVLCGAPIGDPADASPRLALALADADIVAAEDTRRIRRLAASLGIRLPERVVSYHDANESSRTAGLVADLQAGATVALVTDAGMPAVSDPGYRLVAAAAAAGIRVTVVPGPSSVTAALAVSGLPTDRWVFEGFLPRKAGERRTRIEQLAVETRTLVVLEAPHRVAPALAALAEGLGERPAALCRELTKTYEEVVRLPLSALADWAAGREVRGEITLVIAGAPGSTAATEPADLAEGVALREAAGLTRKDAMVEVAREAGVPRRTVYDAVLAARR